jgi:hypothetical protein
MAPSAHVRGHRARDCGTLGVQVHGEQREPPLGFGPFAGEAGKDVKDEDVAVARVRTTLFLSRIDGQPEFGLV